MTPFETFIYQLIYGFTLADYGFVALLCTTYSVQYWNDKFYFGIGMNYTYANGKGSIVGESSSSGEIDLSMHIPGIHFKLLYNNFK